MRAGIYLATVRSANCRCYGCKQRSHSAGLLLHAFRAALIRCSGVAHSIGRFFALIILDMRKKLNSGRDLNGRNTRERQKVTETALVNALHRRILKKELRKQNLKLLDTRCRR